MTCHHHAIYGYRFARTNQQRVSYPDGGGSHLALLSIHQQPCLVGLEAEQFLQCFSRLAPRPCFQVFAQADEGDEHGRGFEEYFAMGAEGAEKSEQGIEIGSGGAKRHQHIHIGAFILQGMKGACVKGKAGGKLHRTGQQQVQPADERIVVPGHGEHDRQGSEQAEDEQVPLPGQVFLLLCRCILFFHSS